MTVFVPKNTDGFTLIESLVALTLLMVGLIPAFLQASSALALSTTARNALIAANLAQEGVEVVRSVRDANWFAARPFDDGLSSCASGCLVQWDSQELQQIGTNPPLKLDAATGLYQYSTGEDSLFSRAITVTKISDIELSVTSKITWHERTSDKEFSVEYHLFDWLKE